MIFNSNTTYLNDVTPMAEGYDSGIGAAQALIEGVRNDYAMFQAMLGIDARELQIRNESAGYVNEGEIYALQESAVGSIWHKIAEFFKKLAAKIKGIWHTFMSKINSLFMKDRDMVRKYEKELIRKSNLGNMEIKVCDIKNGHPLEGAKAKIDGWAGTTFTPQNANAGWDQEASKRLEHFLKDPADKKYDSESDCEEAYDEYYFDDESTEQLKDTKYGSIRNITNFLRDASKDINKLSSAINKLGTKLDKFVTAANKEANRFGKDYHTDEDLKKDKSNLGAYGLDSKKDDEFEKDKHDLLDAATKQANEAYDMAVARQTALLCMSRCIMNAVKKDYKQCKMIFMKAIAANNDKLEESFIDAYAEAAANEVTDVLDRALSNEELSKINVASKNVLDPDVSDDPGKLTYQPDSYFPNKSYVSASGSVDTDINSKSESAMFGQLLY